jgi:hypothetical protein
MSYVFETLCLMAPQASGVLTLVVAVLLVAGGYYASLLLHPNHTCPRGKGTGRHRGSIFTYAHRPCTRCEGRGRLPRLGTVVLTKLQRRGGAS